MDETTARRILDASNMRPESKGRMLALFNRRDPHAIFTLTGIGRRLGILERDPQAVELSRRWMA